VLFDSKPVNGQFGGVFATQLAEQMCQSVLQFGRSAFNGECQFISVVGYQNRGVLNWHSVAQLRCSAVAGCANNQLTNLQVADQLERRGILYAPDYVINSGGLIYMALTHQGAQPESINQHLLRISKRLTGIYAHAQAEKRSPARVSDELAKKLLYGGD